MSSVRHPNDAILLHINELTARVVAESGIPSDIYHLGKIILMALKETPDFVLQIDGGTGQSETSGQCLKRAIKCAIVLKNMGLKTGDVMVLMAPNHLDIAVAFYAALALGIIISPIDKALKVAEIRDTFEITRPKIIFCQSENVASIQEALRIVSSDAKVVSFDKGDHDCCFSEFLDRADEDEIRNFRPADFDPANTFAFVTPTSGTTGVPKSAASTHKNFAIAVPYFWNRSSSIPPVKSSLIVSPIQWLTALVHFTTSPYLKITRLQTSLPISRDHIYNMINKYKPEYMLISPTLMTTLIKPDEHDKCDFTCFNYLSLAGSAVHKDVIDEVKKLTPKTEITNLYGMSESNTTVFSHGHSSPDWSLGKPTQCFLTKLVDIESRNEIKEPNVSGELLIKGSAVFKEYYNSPKVTEEVFVEDGWFKTGDIFYRDEHWNFYYVDRIKLLLKYRNHQVSPVELEGVILQHPKVLDVAVTSVPDRECGDLPVACVIPKPGPPPTAEEIKEIVKANLTDTKQLRGGVVFLTQLPTTTSGKVHRRRLRELVLTMKRE